MNFIVFIFLFFSLQAKAQTNLTQLNLVRENYSKAVTDKTLCADMIKELETIKNEPIFLGYLGGLQIIWAKHVINPFRKLKTFKKGKTNLEKAIFIEPYNAELRLIRITIQKNTPQFLNYNANTIEDEIFIKKNRKTIKSPILQNHIETITKN